MSRDYYNRRSGVDGGKPRLSLDDIRGAFAAAYEFLDQKGYLQLAFGYHCVDAGDVAGTEGSDLRMAFYLGTGIRVEDRFADWLRAADETCLFTAAEFLWDHVAKPKAGTGRYHDFSACGWHFSGSPDKFDLRAAKEEWRTKVNTFLKFYGEGFLLSPEGEIVRVVADGMRPLVEKSVAPSAAEKDRAKMNNAVHMFHLGRSTREQRQQALRDLADVLEFHRPAITKHLTKKDENDLFNIANNFAVRHHNAAQRDDYAEDMLTLIFYIYLASAHFMLGRVHGPTSVSASTTTTESDQDPF